MNQFNFKNNLNPEIEKKSKKKTWKFWLAFWSISAVLLFGWFLFLEYRKSGLTGLANFINPFIKLAPIEEQQKNELTSIFKIASILSEKQEVQTYLILFQNNLELRPGGGFIGSFGILKIQNGKVLEIGVHDTNIFDDRMATEVTPPYPMEETLRIKSWEMRDSNWSPDFPENAQKAIEFYKLQGGGENFDGVIAVSTELLTTFLKFTGPISIEGFPGEYTSENAIEKLEYQVERGYAEQEIEKGQRKYIMKYLAKEILEKAQDLSLHDKKELLLQLEKHMNQKDVMIDFFDPELQEEILKLDWDGEVIENNSSDYLMMVDANLASYKTDAKMIRTFKYQVDFSKEKPTARLEITYQNTAQNKDWMTNDYQSYLRVYAPSGSWLLDSNNHHPMKFGEEFNKKYFGTLVQIPINQTRTYYFDYTLPENIKFEDYNLIIQKQSGVSAVEGEIEIIQPNGHQKLKKEVNINQDWSTGK